MNKGYILTLHVITVPALIVALVNQFLYQLKDMLYKAGFDLMRHLFKKI